MLIKDSFTSYPHRLYHLLYYCKKTKTKKISEIIASSHTHLCSKCECRVFFVCTFFRVLVVVVLCVLLPLAEGEAYKKTQKKASFLRINNEIFFSVFFLCVFCVLVDFQRSKKGPLTKKKRKIERKTHNFWIGNKFSSCVLI